MLYYTEIQLFMGENHSLKDKRHIVHSIKDRLKSRFNLSVRELDINDKWQRATLGIAYVCQNEKEIEKMKRNIKDQIYLIGNAEIYSVEEKTL